MPSGKDTVPGKAPIKPLPLIVRRVFVPADATVGEILVIDWMFLFELICWAPCEILFLYQVKLLFKDWRRKFYLLGKEGQ